MDLECVKKFFFGKISTFFSTRVFFLDVHVLAETPPFDQTRRISIRFSHVMEHQLLHRLKLVGIRHRYYELLKGLRTMSFRSDHIDWNALRNYGSVKLIFWAMSSDGLNSDYPIYRPIIKCETFIRKKDVITRKCK